MPDIGTTLLDRLTVPVASLAFGLLRFIASSLPVVTTCLASSTWYLREQNAPSFVIYTKQPPILEAVG
jgi:hypothetical protein